MIELALIYFAFAIFTLGFGASSAAKSWENDCPSVVACLLIIAFLLVLSVVWPWFWIGCMVAAAEESRQKKRFADRRRNNR